MLILTNSADATADAVQRALADRGVACSRFDLADFPHRAELTWQLESAQQYISTPEGRIDLTDITSVYYRRPGAITASAGEDRKASAFATAEARAGLIGVLLSLTSLWVNSPSSELAASYKPLQLAAARRCGLPVPSTIITTVQADALRFFDEAETAVVYKTLGHDFLPADLTDLGAPTTVVQREAVDDSIAATVTMFQSFVDKIYDVRATVVGSKIFAAAVHGHSEATRVDWRVDYTILEYTNIEVPDDVTRGIARLMDSLSLLFATIDFAVDEANRWFFLDLNPNGQWLWLSRALNLPIAEELAVTLSR